MISSTNRIEIYEALVSKELDSAVGYAAVCEYLPGIHTTSLHTQV